MPTTAATNLMQVGLPDQLAKRLGVTIATIAGTGTTQILGTSVRSNTCLLTTTGGAIAFTLSNNWLVGQSVQLFNTSSTAALVYPPSGSAIDGGSTDASISLAQNEGITLLRTTNTSWRSGNSALDISGNAAIGGNLTVSGTTGLTGLATLTAGANSADNITYTVIGKGPVLKQGANGRVGTFVANGVTPVVISNTSVTITDAIIISLNTVGGTVGVQPHIATITAATGFTVICTAADTSTYNYTIIKNAA